MKRGLAAVVGASLLGGCASGLPLNPDVVVSGRDFVAVSGEADVVVRTYLTDPAGQRLEVGGAACTVTSSLYNTRLTTPTRLRLPNFGPQSPILNVACEAGKLKGAAQQPIATYWRSAPAAPYWYGPGWGPGWGGWYGPGWGPGWGPSYPMFDYPEIAVMLK
ncbi:MAG: hypothetical protein U1E34_08715 [Amaricoccus sp.]